MKHFAGLDISMKETSVCIVDEAGSVILETVVQTDPKCISHMLKKTGYEITKVALESGSLSNWLTTKLLSEGLPAICVDARHMSAILSINTNKNDKNDARGIAQAVRVGFIKEVDLKPNEHIDIKNFISARKALVQQRTQLKNTIRGLLKSYGLRFSTTGKGAFLTCVRQELGKTGPLTLLAIEELLTAFEMIDTKIKTMDVQIDLLCSKDEDVKLLMTIPGVGRLTALSFKIVLGNPKRFENSKNVAAYLGLTPKEYSSGEVERRGRITKCGHSQMRSLLVEAGMSMLTRSKKWSKPKAWAMKIQRKKGLRKASVALARKLSVIMHRMLITREDFKYGEPGKAAA